MFLPSSCHILLSLGPFSKNGWTLHSLNRNYKSKRHTKIKENCNYVKLKEICFCWDFFLAEER